MRHVFLICAFSIALLLAACDQGEETAPPPAQKSEDQTTEPAMEPEVPMDEAPMDEPSMDEAPADEEPAIEEDTIEEDMTIDENGTVEEDEVIEEEDQPL